jgi:purine-binding chemotaxis protein CheW
MFRPGTWPKRAYAIELGSTRVAVTGCEIRTITVREPVVALPLAAPGIVGVIEVGQALVPVLDLASRLGLPADVEVGIARGWLLVDGRDGQFVVRADASIDLGLIERSAVSPVPRTAFAVGKESVIGIVRVTGQPIALVDLDLM